jgi:peptidoglycan/xylan/chitin deacetylase (PgdA/CDA1 family)
MWLCSRRLVISWQAADYGHELANHTWALKDLTQHNEAPDAASSDLRYGVLLWSDHITGSNARNDVNQVLRDVSPGSVVLAHDGGPEPNATLVQQLDRLVGSLKDAGYQFLTASELLAVPDRAA